MMLDRYSIVVLFIVTGLGALFYELLIKNQVSTKGSRLFFYFLVVLHVLAFQRFDFPDQLNFLGDLTMLNLGRLVDATNVNDTVEDHFINIVLLVYFIGAAFGLVKLMLGFSKVIRLISRSTAGRHKFERLVKVANFQPCTFFTYILIPEGLSKPMYNSVYKHESYHFHQMHTLDMIVWHLLSILFWFNPFVHLLKAKQSRNLEYDTDKHMVKCIPKEQYCEHLLSTTFNSGKIDWYPMFNKSNIYLRIKRLNNNQKGKRRRSGLTLALAFTFLFGGTILSKASFPWKAQSTFVNQISKPEFRPHGLGHYLDSVFQARMGDEFDYIDKAYHLQLTLDITIDEVGKVIKVTEDSDKSKRGGDAKTNNLLSGLLMETIRNMPNWTPAKENGISVMATIHEEFLFTGESE